LTSPTIARLSRVRTTASVDLRRLLAPCGERNSHRRRSPVFWRSLAHAQASRRVLVEGYRLHMHQIEPLDRRAGAAECVELIVTSEPWLTLGVSREVAFAVLTDAAKEVNVIRDAKGVAGFVVIDMRGLLRGYVQILCVRADCRRCGLGSALLRWAEQRILRDSPNVFICVSSFNAGARRLYERLGFELVGTFRELLVPGHDELLLRKTRGPWTAFRKTPA
jgi:ribosomal protein S18 acetylase RimI-like enzyme